MGSVLVVLYILVILLSTSSNFALAEDCSQYQLSVANTTALLQPVLYLHAEGSTYHKDRTYFQPLEGFKGVSVDIDWLENSSTSVTTTFFKWYEHCLPDSGAQRWWVLEVGCSYTKARRTVGYWMAVNDCYWVCYKTYTSLLDKPWKHLHWTAHGPSRWRRTPSPNGCPW